MTLRLLIQRVDSKEEFIVNSTLQLEVLGSKAGPLESTPIAGSGNIWDPMFKVDSSHSDCLTILLHRLKHEKRVVVASTYLNCAAFIKQEEKDLDMKMASKCTQPLSRMS